MKAIAFVLMMIVFSGFVFRRFQQQKSKNFFKKCEHLFQQLYVNIDGHLIAAQARLALRENNSTLLLHSDSFVYGEITFNGFIDMLRYAQPKPGEIFYDLGCGVGKAVILAALFYDFKKVCGIELLSELYQSCMTIRSQFFLREKSLHYFPKKKFAIEFSQEDLLNGTWLDADIIFINATAFRSIWPQLTELFLKLRPGTRIIVTSLQLPTSDFDCLEQGNWLMSWDYCSAYVYRRR